MSNSDRQEPNICTAFDWDIKYLKVLQENFLFT